MLTDAVVPMIMAVACVQVVAPSIVLQRMAANRASMLMVESLASSMMVVVEQI